MEAVCACAKIPPDITTANSQCHECHGGKRIMLLYSNMLRISLELKTDFMAQISQIESQLLLMKPSNLKSLTIMLSSEI